MTRVLVLLLVAPTLLMPPGMCVCRYFHGEAQQSPADTRTAAAHPAPACTCESCREARGAEAPEHHTPAKPKPADHVPGCPAVEAATVTALAPVVAVVSCDLALAPLDQPTPEPLARPSRTTDTPVAPFAAHVLAHRVLLI